MSEFTGERLVPGEVDSNLWNEHISRYAFAASFCSGRERVLDAGCGTGYGSSFLSRRAAWVFGIDYSADAIDFAARHYGGVQTKFSVGLCESLPLSDGSVDLVVAFEVIEHLEGWRKFLEECGRVLSGDGLLLVSTPNKLHYTESRGDAGPNPFHVHEFDFAEFRSELEQFFPNVRIYGQTHAENVVFSVEGSVRESVRFESLHADPEQAGFLVAVCGARELREPANFVFVPKSANLLREREMHIGLLREELDFKDAELLRIHSEHAQLVHSFRERQTELERSNDWAGSLNAHLAEARLRIQELQGEFASEQALASGEIQRLQGEFERVEQERREQVEELQRTIEERGAWAQDLDRQLARQVEELTRCVDYLHAAEQTIADRTAWAQNAQGEADELRGRFDALEREKQEYRNKLEVSETKLAGYEASRWVRLGSTLHIGPLSR